MGGEADRHMSDFDINNFYGVRALVTLFKDTTTAQGVMPELIGVYKALPFIGEEGEGEATGRWPNWDRFRETMKEVWSELQLFAFLMEEVEWLKEAERMRGLRAKESQ